MKLTKQQLRNQRNAIIKSQFCCKGTFMDAKGKTIEGVCMQVYINEIITLLNAFDAKEDSLLED